MDEMVARVGPRLPGWEDARRDLRLGVIAVHRRPLTTAEITYLEAVVRRFGAGPETSGGWAWATGGRSSVTTTLPEPGSSLPPAGVEPAP